MFNYSHMLRVCTFQNAFICLVLQEDNFNNYKENRGNFLPNINPHCIYIVLLIDASCEMLHFGYSLIMSTLDFLMVAQCASLVHKVAIAGWELMQFPWVRAGKIVIHC